MSIIEIARNNNEYYKISVGINPDDIFSNPQIYQVEENRIGKLFYTMDENGIIYLGFDVVPHYRTSKDETGKELLYKKDGLKLIVGGIASSKGIYADPACSTGTTTIQMKQVYELDSKYKVFTIHEIAKMIDEGKIEDPYVQCAVHQLVQKLRSEGKYKYEDATTHSMEETKIEDFQIERFSDMGLSLTSEGEMALNARISELEKNNAPTEEIEKINKKIESIEKQKAEKFNGLGKYAAGVKITFADEEIFLRSKQNIVATIVVSDDGKFTFVEQFRGGVGGSTLETPAGRVEEIESVRKEEGFESLSQEEQEEKMAEANAKKEVDEEAGKEGKIIKIAQFRTPNTFNSTTRVYTMFGAKNVKEQANTGESGEIDEVREYSIGEVLDKIASGEILDTNTILGVYSVIERCERIVEQSDNKEYSEEERKIAKIIVSEL